MFKESLGMVGEKLGLATLNILLSNEKIHSLVASGWELASSPAHSCHEICIKMRRNFYFTTDKIRMQPVKAVITSRNSQHLLRLCTLDGTLMLPVI